jgi:anti-sigma factor RsiW
MTARGCDLFTLADLADYAARELPEDQATAIEEHLFSCPVCAARAAELEALVRAIGSAVRSAAIPGFVTDTILNRLAREGVRVRAFTLSPGDVVHCAVWEDDDVMALRLRADFGGARLVTLSQRVAGRETVRATSDVAGSPAEIIHVLPAAWVRELPVVEVEVLLTTHENGQERELGSYTLLHGGTLRR